MIMNNEKDKTIIAFNLLIVIIMGSLFLATWLDTTTKTTEAAATKQTTTNQNLNVTTMMTTKINQVIGEGLNECSDLDTDSCLGVMYTLDEICQVAFFPSCFGADWTNFMNHLQNRIDKGDYPDARYADDPYLTLNNHHYGNSDWVNNK